MQTIKDRDLYAIAIAAEKCHHEMGMGVEADRDALMALVSVFHESIGSIIDRYEYAEADHTVSAGSKMEEGVFLDFRNAVEDERHSKPPFSNQYSTLYAVNGHVVG